MSILQRSVQDLKGVGPQLAARLQNLQIKNFQDILFHLPLRYVDRTRIHPIGTLRIDDLVVIEASVIKTTVIPKPKRSLSVRVQDSSGVAELKFFHFNADQQAQFAPGKLVRCFGQVRRTKFGLQIIHPEYRIISPDTIYPVEEYLTPIYPTTDGVSQKLLRALVQQVLTLLQPIATALEILPPDLRLDQHDQSLLNCLQQLHFPLPDAAIELAQKRLAFEELLAQHLSLRQKRAFLKRDHAYSISGANSLWQKLLSQLPFSLTSAQLKTIEVISSDLAKPYPMLRLVQGDVGSGKTLVAMSAALMAIEGGYQVAFMVPTEILAEQHLQNIKNWFAPLKITTECLTGKLSPKQKSEINGKIMNNMVQLVIGTHALFQDNVQFNNLALVIIDEQHKFGVAQRLALQRKAKDPNINCHQLILTATPIPRSLAMTFYADLDYAVIDELPPGRKPINTLMVAADRRDEILSRIAELCKQGQQVYWVCTLIEESELIDSTPAEQAYADLQQQLPNLKIGLIHGRLKASEKEQIMLSFKQGSLNLLVATTVIEVGVDVPNASLMVIENPERLGLAQLHQLRGRVGRGAQQSFCVLLYKKPLSEKAAQRLQFLRDCQDGFALAEFDLKLRGAGEVFGTRQSGLANLRIADLVRDKDLLPKVHASAEIILSKHNELVSGLLQRWLREQVQYAAV